MRIDERDPVVDALPEERPSSLAQMSAKDRGRVARYFLIACGAGMPEPLAWHMATFLTPAIVAEQEEVVANMTDEEILAIAASLPDDGPKVYFGHLADPRDFVPVRDD